MQIKLDQDAQELLKELIAVRKQVIPDYRASLTALGNAMIRMAATQELNLRKKKP